MAGTTVTVIDSGLSNIGSVVNMLRRIGVEASTTADPDAVARAERLIMPGIGAFDAGMQRLHETGLHAALTDAVRHRAIPTLGICLGMQLLGRGSEEGRIPGLGWIAADVVRFQPADLPADLRIPHMGWCEVQPLVPHALFAGLESGARFYFVHSFHVPRRHQAFELATSVHGFEFVCAIGAGNLAGVQFHPEKSHRFGMRLLSNFATWQP